MLPQDDSFQKQLNDLQRSYANLGKSPGMIQQPRKIRRCAGIEEAKAIAKDELFPGEEATVFDRDKDLFYALSKKEDGTVNPVLIGTFTLEQEPPPPEYITKQDFESFKKELLDAIRKGETA
jgi:hypothetical protein